MRPSYARRSGRGDIGLHDDPDVGHVDTNAA
jgi:hypothetical protein